MKTSDGEMRGGSPRGDQADLQHTQEPTGWRVGYSDGSGEEYIVDANDNAVATIRWGCGCCKSTRPLDDDEIKHALLIAAAPATAAAASNMLAALKEIETIARRFKYLEATGNCGRIASRAIASAEAAGIKPRT